MTLERDHDRLKYTEINLAAAYFRIAGIFEAAHPGASLTIPQEGGYRTPPQQAATGQTGASGYNGISGFSKHQAFPARALDFMVIEAGKLIIDGRHPLYRWVGLEFEDQGFKWGGSFHKPDWDHVEIRGAQPSFEEVRSGFAAYLKAATVKA